MATNNQLNLPLSGSTGTGTFVGATSPTLVTPTLGAALATSVNFGFASLDYYRTGTWTPTDASGAALSLTTNAAYTRIGNMVFAYAQITYPVTVDASAALLNGLPFASPNQSYAIQGCLSKSSTANAGKVAMLQNNNSMGIYTSAGVGTTNAQLSAATINFIMIYPVA